MRWFWMGLVTSLLLASCGDDDGTPAGDASPPSDDGGASPPGDGGAPDGESPDGAGPADTGPAEDAGPRPIPTPTVAPFDCTTADPGITPGEAITAPPMEWTFVPVPGTVCMDGTETGIGVNLNPDSDRVMVFFEGGNACFDDISCLAVAHIDGFDASDFPATIRLFDRGILNRADPENPVRDWSYVFVPYCSGDVHAGATDSGAMGLVQQGFRNTTRFLERIVPTFRDASLVLWAGQSAGGFGAAFNYDQAQRAFGCTPVYLLDDAGPPMADEYLRPCIQRTWRTVWNLDANVPADCPACLQEDGGGLANLVAYLGAKYRDRRLAMLSSTEDRTIRSFYGYGYSRGCRFPSLMPAEDYAAGLLDLRDRVTAPYPSYGMFLTPGEFHTFTQSRLASASSGGVTLAEWVRALVDDDPSWGNVGP